MRPNEAGAADAGLRRAPPPLGLRIGLVVLALAAADAAAIAGELAFTPHLIACSADSVRGVAAADLDGDGDLDVIAANLGHNEVAWYESTPAAYDPPGFIEHIIATNRRASSFVMAIDMDGDGDHDIISSSVNDDEISWYQNDGKSPPSFTTHVITVDPNDDPNTPPEGIADAVRAIDVADLDGDGDLDVCSSSVDDDRVAWFENSGDPGGTWIPREVTSSLDGARAVRAADLDQDGDPDIAAGGWFDDRLLWFENQGGTPPAFVEHVVATFPPDPANPGLVGQFWEIVAVDPDGDGDTDLAAMRQYRGIEWYENDGAVLPQFTRRVIKPATGAGKSIQAADLDQDGDADLQVAERDDGRVSWYENLGGLPPDFLEHVFIEDPDGPPPPADRSRARPTAPDTSCRPTSTAMATWTSYGVPGTTAGSGGSRSTWPFLPPNLDAGGHCLERSGAASGRTLALVRGGGFIRRR